MRAALLEEFAVVVRVEGVDETHLTDRHAVRRRPPRDLSSLPERV